MREAFWHSDSVPPGHSSSLPSRNSASLPRILSQSAFSGEQIHYLEINKDSKGRPHCFQTSHQSADSLKTLQFFFLLLLLSNCFFTHQTSEMCFHSFCFENVLSIKHIFVFLIYTSFSGSHFTFLPACVWWPRTTEIWTSVVHVVCLHLSKSGVNWILLYVPDSDYKCKVACTELYVPLLWGSNPLSLFHQGLGMMAPRVGGK